MLTENPRPPQGPDQLASGESHTQVVDSHLRAISVLNHTEGSQSHAQEMYGGYLAERFRSENNIYPASHPIPQYINEIFRRINTSEGMPDVIVFDALPGTIDAHIRKSGQILISRDMIEMCDFEEEIMAVLAHEIRHYRNGDFSESERTADDYRGGEFDQALGRLGSYMREEWTADLAGLLDLDNSGINPYGAALFFKKLSRHTKQRINDDFSNTHGSSTDRYLNVITSTGMYDFEHMSSTNLTPINKDLFQDPHMYISSGGQGGNLYCVRSSFSANDTDLNNKRIIASKNLSFFQAVLVLPQVKDVYTTTLSRYNAFKNPGNQISLEHDTQVLTHCMNIIENTVFSDAEIPNAIQSKVFHMVLLLVGKWEYFSMPDAPDALSALDHDFSDSFKGSDYGDGQVLAEAQKFIQKHKLLLLAQTPAIVLNFANLDLRKGEFEDDDGKLDFSKVPQCIRSYHALISGLFGGLDQWDEENILRSLRSVLLEGYPGVKDQINTYFEHEHNLQPQGGGSKNKNQKTTGYSVQSIHEFLQKGNIYDAISAFESLGLEESPTEENISLAILIKNEILNIQSFREKESLLEVFMRIIAKPIITAIRPTNLGDLKILAQNIHDLSRDNLTFLMLIENSFFSQAPEDTIYENLEDVTEIFGLLFPRGFTDIFSGADSSVNIHFVYAYLRFANRELESDNPDLTRVLDILTRMRKLNIVIVSSWDSSRGKISDEEEAAIIIAQDQEYISFKNNFLHRYISLVVQTNTDKQQHLLELVEFVDNVADKNTLKRGIAESIIANLSFDEGFPLIFGRDFSTDIVEEFIEKKARTHAQIERCKSEVLRRMRFDDKEEDIPLAYHLTHYLLSGRDKMNVLKLALNTASDEGGIKGEIYDAYLRAGVLGEIFTRDMFLLIDSLYLMTDIQKMAFLRKLLMGKGGILHSPQSRIDLLEYFCSIHFKNQDGPIEQELIKFLRTMMQEGDIDDVYFIISSILLDRIFLPPREKKKAPFPDEYLQELSQTASSLKEEFPSLNIEYNEQYGLLYVNGEILLIEDNETGERNERIYQAWTEATFNFSKRYDAWVDSIVSKGGNAFIAREAKNEQEREELLRNIYLLFPDEAHRIPKTKEKMDAAELVIQIAKHLGSIGIRFLQVMGQYISIPEELKPAFSEVYDSVQGQSKLVAFTTLQRHYPGFDNKVHEMGETLGGGSIATVYDAIDSNKGARVLKIINPSFQFQYEKMFTALTHLFTALSKHEPKYNVALTIIADIRDWIAKDAQYQGFLDRDRRFYKEWNGWKKSKKDRYSIQIPISYGPESIKYKEEEKVDGHNLTQLDTLRSQGHDIALIVETIIAHYIEQIKDGQVHSDVHAGNFRITQDNKIAVLDRSFYLEIGWKDKLFISSLFNSLHNTEELYRKFIDFVKGLPENSNIDFDMIQSLDLSSTNGIDGVFQVLAHLRKSHVHIPLWITLLVKNMNALYDLAQKNGVKLSL